MLKKKTKEETGIRNTTMENTGMEAEAGGKADGEKAAKPKKPKRSIGSKLGIVANFICVMIGCYLIAVYSHIPFIEKWRTIYIETAMGTMTHQWLATAFIPGSVIDDVMADIYAKREQQKDLASTWVEKEEVKETETETEVIDNRTQEEIFYETFWEVDTEEFRAYVDAHPELIENGYLQLDFEDLSWSEGLVTAVGDRLLAVDAANNLILMDVRDSEYVGKLSIIKNPAQVDLVKATQLGTFGDSIFDFGENNNALVAINASRFTDPDGHGSGAEVAGSLVIDGVDYGRPHKKDWKFFGMKYDNRFYITNYSKEIIPEYRWALECLPALIVDGESVIDGTFGMGIQPRTTIGQTENGDFMFLVVDGRQIGYSLGCTVAECNDIMLRYHCYQAGDMDGGSSSVMWYKGQLITKSSSASGTGRYTPDALIFRPVSDID